MSDLAFRSVIYDLDGVITKTALVHAAAWKACFDEYLKSREERFGEPFREFTHEKDYLPYVDGKPRYEGVKSFLESRGVNIDFGDPEDPPAKETVCGIGNRKNIKFVEILEKDGIEQYDSTVKLIKELKEAGVKIGVASSSKNCKYVLKTAGLEELFETRVDGEVSAKTGLRGKPEGDIFVAAAANVGTKPFESVVVEDASSGVQAGRNGAFGLVLGLARENNKKELFENGADIAAADIEPVDIPWINKWFQREPVMIKPDLSGTEVPITGIDDKDGSIAVNPVYSMSLKNRLTSGKRPVFFIDFDGTLSHIADNPEAAYMPSETKEILEKLSGKFTVAVVSGRPVSFLKEKIGIDSLFYAGSHGMDIKGPDVSMVCSEAERSLPLINEVRTQLEGMIGDIKGVILENKDFSLGIHYRLVEEADIPGIEQAVGKVTKDKGSLEVMNGKKVFEIMPNIDWDKGTAVRWIMESLEIPWVSSAVLYIGDDLTDEDAFRMIRTRGTGILVSEKAKVSNADFRISSPDDARVLLENIMSI